MFKSLKKNNYLFLYLTVIAVINIYLQTLPLTNVFGYEFSEVNSLLLSLFAGLFTISVFKSVSKEKKSFQFSSLFGPFVYMLLIPFLISFIKSIFTGFCSFWDGLLFYMIITIPSVFIGSGLSMAAFYAIKKFRVVLFLILYVMILLIPVLEIYFNPQIYLYNPLFAYFPGTIYDEGLSVDFKLILYRIFNLTFFIGLLYYTLRQLKIAENKSYSKFFYVGLILVLITFYFFISPLLGFTTPDTRLKGQLTNRIESENFVTYADSRIEKQDLELIAINQEYSYFVLDKFFQVKPAAKITSYIFYDRYQKKNLFGSGNADVAKPWLYSIYVSYDSWESTLKHEIAHCFTSNFGSGIFKLAAGFNPALIEGVAEAADGFYDENDIHYLAAIAYKNNYRINLKSLFSSFSFFGSVSSLSYIYAGSFVKYLVENYGIQKIKEFYKTNNFHRVYEKELSTVIKNYEEFLDTLKLESTKEKAFYYFGGKPLISKVCPRYISSALVEGWEYYSSKHFDNAREIFIDILDKTENYSAVIGLSKIYDEEDSLLKAITLLYESIPKYLNTRSEFDIKFQLAELYVKNSESEKALELYQAIYKAKPNRRLELLSQTRIHLYTEGRLDKYVSGSDFDKYTLLKKMNSKLYKYSTIPLMIDLSELLDEDYSLFLENFKENFEVKDELSSYAVYKVSEYMLKNFDYVNARKLAALALRYKTNSNLFEVTSDHFKKTEWFAKNVNDVLSKTKFEIN